MDELIGQITSILRGAWKHRWYGVLAAWVVFVVGTIVVVVVPDRYEASARIFVDTQSILKPLMSGLAVQPNIEQQVTMLSRTLISRPNVEKLVRMADLDLKDQSKDQREAMIENLIKDLQIKNVGRDNLYTLSYRDPQPEKAKRVVQSLVSIFVESSLGDTRKDNDTAKKFIDEQIKSYTAKLEEAETRLKEFKLRNIELDMTEGKDSAGRISEISSQLNQARLELREAENAKDSARRQLDVERAQNARILQDEPASAISTPEIDSRIDAQKRSLDALLQRYTEQHPDVMGARRLIKELEELKRKEVAELRKKAVANPAVTVNSSPAQQELARLLATSEVQVASLRARVGEYESRYKRARESMKTAPQIEAEFTQLNRDYAINKKNYEDLVSRRESATLSGDLENAASIADFRLIDPPRVSPNPVAPNRLLIMPLALLAALGAGIGVSFLISQLRPVFHDARTLSAAIDLPILGTVSMVMSDPMRQKRKSDHRKFALASGSMLVAFGAVMAVFSFLSSRLG